LSLRKEVKVRASTSSARTVIIGYEMAHRREVLSVAEGCRSSVERRSMPPR
jgi:hypothetical protein